ncbi:MAG TPA: DPP IV N-terminal domain-containing protein [Candidatus Acidoferrales bacterium]|nr:DPP IV N-terminal domain-containing protein [Candidatus Acidoferrales bacterium]
MKVHARFLISLRRIAVSAALAGSLAAGGALCAQTQPYSPRALTSDDYARAEKFLGYKTSPLVSHLPGRATWLPDDRFWYRSSLGDGSEFVLVDPAKGTRTAPFDHDRLAAALSAATGNSVDGHHLPFMDFEFVTGENAISLAIRGRRWKCELQSYQCVADASFHGIMPPGGRGGGRGGATGRLDSPSPDGKSTVFIRDYNLWLRDLSSNKETQLTTDGVKDFGYATDNAGWTKSDRAIVAWSPDSKKIATYQQDQRNVGDMYLVRTQVGHPVLEQWKYPLPGDATVTMIQRVIIDLSGGSAHVTRLQMPPDQHRSTLCDDIACARGEWTDVQWSADGKSLAFVSTSRDHKKENLRVADAETGAIRDVFEETATTQYESGLGHANWKYLPETNEFIWFSEKSDWGQLYLYDLASGKLKNQITQGEGPVTQMLRVDEKDRLVYFLAAGKEKGVDPYFVQLYSVAFDGSKQTLLTAESKFTHDVNFSTSGRYFVDNFSKPDVAPVSILRDATGKTVTVLERTDISKLQAAGWQPPVPIMVKARDGVTDLYGLMYRPTHLDSTKKYPIVNYIYPGPQTGSVGSRNFSASRGDAQALAELRFVVVQIDGMGTPWRSKKFHDADYADMGDNTLPDQVTGMKQLAARYAWIDIDRVGIFGHSGGGFATADAMFRYPDFFKVGISESGNHDNREYEDDWGERYQGLLTRTPSGGTNYDDQANQNIAKNLKGHLLLAHGTVDDNVPPYNTLLVVDALIKANKDFDLIMLPNQRHGYGPDADYMMRRRWDYFVRYLLGAEPPREFQLRTPANPFAEPQP